MARINSRQTALYISGCASLSITQREKKTRHASPLTSPPFPPNAPTHDINLVKDRIIKSSRTLPYGAHRRLYTNKQIARVYTYISQTRIVIYGDAYRLTPLYIHACGAKKKKKKRKNGISPSSDYRCAHAKEKARGRRKEET